jgi:hypothetical protein
VVVVGKEEEEGMVKGDQEVANIVRILKNDGADVAASMKGRIWNA